MRGLLKGKMLMVLNHFHCAKHFAIMYCAPFDTVCVCFTFSRFGVVFYVCLFFLWYCKLRMVIVVLLCLRSCYLWFLLLMYGYSNK